MFLLTFGVGIRLRASSAAPTYFKEFHHETSQETFQDGGLKFNNPVGLANEERRILWPESKDQDPDILLSIGTGYDSLLQPRPAAQSKPGPLDYLKRLFKLAADILQNDLDCQRIWRDFRDSQGIYNFAPETERKYVRLNIDLKDADFGKDKKSQVQRVPLLDQVKKMEILEKIAKGKCSDDDSELALEISRVANTLIASLFYFKVSGIDKEGTVEGDY